MASERRIEKMKNLLREELAKILDREVDFPQDSIVTITKVSISPDAYYAAVFISILGKEPASALEILQKKVYNIQQALNRRVRMRPVPKIRFAIDEGELQREKIEKSLARLKLNKEI